MRTDAFRDWLKARRWNGEPLTSVSSRLSKARRFERSMRELGLPYDDLDAAFDMDGMEAATALLRDLCRRAAEAGEAPALLVGDSSSPAKRMNNVAAAVRNYRQFREAGADAGPAPDWPALDELRDAFLDRVPEFERFTLTDNGYERIERTYKNAIAAQVRDIAGSADADEQAGRRIYRALIPNDGPLLRWQTDDDFSRKFPALGPPFYAAIGRLARDPRPIADAIMAAAAAFADLRGQGATTLTLGQVASIAITVAGVVRPGEAAPFKMTKARELAALLTGDPIFRGSVLERDQLERWLDLLRRIEAVMRDAWGWEPRDLVDVQGFAWAALDEGWTDDMEEETEVEEDRRSAIADANHWFVGASYGKTDDQTERFLREGIWHVSTPTERQRDQVRAMRAGDRIAIKATFVQRNNLSFDADGRRVSVMRIKARGTIREASADGETVGVDWERDPRPRDWYFYTYQPTIWQVTPAKEMARRLIRFAFDEEAQDIAWFLSRWHINADPVREEPSALVAADPVNLILHGPPGTGKTFRTVAEAVRLARGLAADDALLADPARRGELRVAYEDLRALGQIRFVTFHQSYGYEDFVEGLRPEALPGGGFELTPRAGLFRQIVEDAAQSPEEHVLVIDEINRANISKVFGELITLLEPDKRIGMPNELRLALPYSNIVDFGVPANLHIIGTMNTADRSIALIDKALRRRFTFREIMPDYGVEGMGDEVEGAGATLADVLRTINDRIEYLLDREHQIGHGWLLGCDTKTKLDGAMRDKVIPLIAEYFFDDWGRTADVLGGRGDNPFLEATELAPPPGMKEEGARTRWTVRGAFAPDAYVRLVAGDPVAGD